MQAAGRLRQFGVGQRLVLTAQHDIDASIRAAAAAADSASSTSAPPPQPPPPPPQRARRNLFGQVQLASEGGASPRPQPSAATSVRHVLLWIMGNTIAASRARLTEWASNGLHFAATSHGAPHSKALLPEKLAIDAFYAHALVQRDVAHAVAAHAGARFDGKWRGSAHPGAAAVVDRVVANAACFGAGMVASSSSLDEECEREQEQEKEQEAEARRSGGMDPPREALPFSLSCEALCSHLQRRSTGRGRGAALPAARGERLARRGGNRPGWRAARRLVNPGHLILRGDPLANPARGHEMGRARRRQARTGHMDDIQRALLVTRSVAVESKS